MFRISVFAIALALAVPPAAHARCAGDVAEHVSIVVATCKVAAIPDAKRAAAYGDRYAGVVITGDNDGVAFTGWIPKGEGVTCAALPTKTIVHATLSHACCDGAPDPPCFLGISARLDEVTVEKPKKK